MFPLGSGILSTGDAVFEKCAADAREALPAVASDKFPVTGTSNALPATGNPSLITANSRPFFSVPSRPRIAIPRIRRPKPPPCRIHKN